MPPVGFTSQMPILHATLAWAFLLTFPIRSWRPATLNFEQVDWLAVGRHEASSALSKYGLPTPALDDPFVTFASSDFNL